jgi:hypothetical protein
MQYGLLGAGVRWGLREQLAQLERQDQLVQLALLVKLDCKAHQEPLVPWVPLVLQEFKERKVFKVLQEFKVQLAR